MKLKDMKIREIKNEMKMGYIASRDFDVDAVSFCNIKMVDGVVEVRVANVEVEKDLTLKYEVAEFKVMTKADIINAVTNAVEGLVGDVEVVASAPVLTEMEIEFLNAMRNNYYSDILYSGGEFYFAVTEDLSYTEEQARGVVTSLKQKGLVETFKYEDEPLVISYTKAGERLFDDADGRECAWGGERLLKTADDVEVVVEDAVEEVVEDAVEPVVEDAVEPVVEDAVEEVVEPVVEDAEVKEDAVVEPVEPVEVVVDGEVGELLDYINDCVDELQHKAIEIGNEWTFSKGSKRKLIQELEHLMVMHREKQKLINDWFDEIKNKIRTDYQQMGLVNTKVVMFNNLYSVYDTIYHQILLDL